jgi:Gpi18-like mannosyltransferase/predicted membrane-bound dolichyl-phosphate-mannose-protein mannosyltransferase
LIIRIWLARSGGFPFDMGTFAAWSNKLATQGPRGFYADPNYFVDYPPGYLYVLLILGRISKFLLGGAPSTFLLKFPGILADLGVAFVAVKLALRATPDRVARRFPVVAVSAAAILLNPAVFEVSAVWGQVDSLLALLVLAALLLLATGPATLRREAGGFVLLTCALLTKPQAAFVIPAALILVLWRHLRAARAEGGGAAGLMLVLSRIGGLGLFSLGVGYVLLIPFSLDLPATVRFYRHAASTYPYTSVWAFNLWGAVGFWKHDTSGSDVVRLFGVPALYVGLGAFALGMLLVAYRLWRALDEGEHEGRATVFAAVAMTCVPFAVLTRIHERYLFLALACLAPLVAYRQLRRALVLLSGLYFLNVYFAYVYYVEYVKRHALKIGWLFNAVYGTAQDSPQKMLLSLATGLGCLWIAWRGWAWIRAGTEGDAEELARAAEPSDVLGAERVAEAAPAAAGRRFGLELHAVGRRGAALALLVFVVVLATRLPGLGRVPGMYFDEVYHARAGGEYLQHKEIYESTHPPLAKELIGLSIKHLSGFKVSSRAAARGGLAQGIADAAPDGVVWADPVQGRGTLRYGRIRSDCSIVARAGSADLDFSPTMVAYAAGGAFVAGRADTGPVLARVEGSRQVWRAQLPGEASSLAAVGFEALVVTASGALVRVQSTGEPLVIAQGAADLSAAPGESVGWVSFPAQSRIASYGQGSTAEAASIQLQGQPGKLLLVKDAGRVLTSDRASLGIESADVDQKTRADRISGAGAERWATVPETGLAWAARGTRVSIIEPRGLSVIGHIDLREAPRALIVDSAHRRVAAVGPHGVACLGGRPQWAWRFGSAVFGSAMAALVALLALRLFGSVLTALLASLFVCVDGLVFTLSRISMIDSYVATFIVAAWFAIASALRAARAGDPDERRWRWGAIAWLVASGLLAGAAASSKWVGLYALAGMVLLAGWDFVRRGREGLGGVLPGTLPSLVLLGGCLAVLPLVVYLVSYTPYFSLGHNFKDFVQLQQGMYSYHAHLTATHPYGSPWYGWPFGHKAVYLYVNNRGGKVAELWTLANPVVLIGGLVGTGVVALAAWRRRNAALAVPVLAALVQYLPWTIVTRVTFIYHYLSVLPFICIAFAWWVTEGRKGEGRRQHALEMAAVGASAVIAFVLTLPLVTGMYTDPQRLQTIKHWLRWMF